MESPNLYVVKDQHCLSSSPRHFLPLQVSRELFWFKKCLWTQATCRKVDVIVLIMVIRIEWYIIHIVWYHSLHHGMIAVTLDFCSWIYLVSFKSRLNCALNRGRETAFRLHSNRSLKWVSSHDPCLKKP